MKKLFKWLLRLVILAVGMVAVVVLFRNPILRLAAERQIQRETGMETILGRVRVDLRSPVVRLENVRLISPPEFGGRLFLDLPEVRLEYDSVALLFRRIRFRQITFRLDELRLVRTAQGGTNLEQLREQLAHGRLSERLARRDWEYDGTDTIRFSVGRLKYLDAREPGKSEEVYIGARDVTLKRLRSLEDVTDTLSRLAEGRGAFWTAEALSQGRLRPVGNAASAK
jgi:uncharacterized protein involved in outer membrane biogenesis